MEIKLTNSNIKSINKENIVAVAFAVFGACGDGGSIEIVTLENNDFIIYTENLKTNAEARTLINEIIPWFSSVRAMAISVKGLPKNWNYIDLGLGNYLLIKEDLYNNFLEVSKTYTRVNIYKNWKTLLNAIINKKDA